jgi:hypothetical protein
VKSTAHVIAVDSTRETEIITHATGRKRMRGYCRSEHDHGQEDHHPAHAEGLLFDALIELNRDRWGASGCLFGSPIEPSHGLPPRFISKRFVCSLSPLFRGNAAHGAMPLKSNFES